ncbi:MAG: Cell division protein FtsQ [Anaerolineae bacterium]|nr:Cell division protein FtsQ [Anaerolineae bacterium]
MSVRRQTPSSEEKPAARRTRRKRQVVGAAPRVRVVATEPRAKTTRPRAPQKRATFDIAAPRIELNPWRTARDWRASRPKFLAGFLLAALATLLWASFNLDAFFVSQPTIIGAKIVPHDEIAQAAGVNGWNIFFVNPRQVESAVRALPEFQDAQVYVTLPNTVEIYTVERTPRFVWEVAGKNFWVDQEGIAMRPRGMVPNGWHVRDAEGRAVKYGERINPDAFNAAAALINAWQAAPKYFEWTKAHGLTLRDEHGWLIYFGSANQMQDKLTALQIVTTQLLRDKRAVTFIDLGSGLPYYQEAAAKTK